jgi:hypothetical protein
MRSPHFGSEKDALKAIDCATNEMRELAKRWNDVVAVEMQTVAKNYADGRLSLICDLYFFPTADKGVASGVVDGPLVNGELLASVILTANIPNVRQLFFSEQDYVFVLDVQLMQMPENFAMPSFVRLNFIHDEVTDIFGGFLFESSVDGMYKAIPGITYKEGSLVFPFTRSIKLNIANGMVECTSEVVESIANDSQQVIVDSLLHAEVKEAVSRMQVILNGDAVRVTIPDLPNLRCKVVDVLVGPLDL